MFGKAFKSRANYVFDYKPRYYDERKERLEKLKKKYSQNSENQTEEKFTSSLIKDSLKQEWKRSKHVAHDKKANLRLVLIITLLVGIFAYLLDLHKLF